MKIIKIFKSISLQYRLFYLFIQIILSIFILYSLLSLFGEWTLYSLLFILIGYGILGIWKKHNKIYLGLGQAIIYVIWLLSWLSFSEYLPLIDEGRLENSLINIALYIAMSVVFTYIILGKKFIGYYFILSFIYLIIEFI